MTVWVAEAHAHVERLVSMVKLATVFEGILLKSSVVVGFFLWAKGLDTKDIHKEIFPVYGEKCLSLEVFHNWIDKFSQERRD
jgi:hypothetical protein